MDSYCASFHYNVLIIIIIIILIIIMKMISLLLGPFTSTSIFFCKGVVCCFRFVLVQQCETLKLLQIVVFEYYTFLAFVSSLCYIFIRVRSIFRFDKMWIACNRYELLREKLLLEMLKYHVGEGMWTVLSEHEQHERLMQLKLGVQRLWKEGKLDGTDSLPGAGKLYAATLLALMGYSRTGEKLKEAEESEKIKQLEKEGGLQVNRVTPRVKPWVKQSIPKFDCMDGTPKCDHSLESCWCFTMMLFVILEILLIFVFMNQFSDQCHLKWRF